MVRHAIPATKSSRADVGLAEPRLNLSPAGRLRQLALLSGMGLSLGGFAMASPSSQAAGPAFGTPAWSAQRAGAQAPAGTAAAGAGRIDVTRGTGSVTTVELATQRTQRSVANLSRAAEAIAGARSAQNAAAAIALDLPSDVPNGLAPGGLQVAARVAIDPSSWQNAELPTQTSGSAGTVVTVEQTAARALLTWDSFNIGRDTTLHIDQSGGTTTRGSNDWIALNRVEGNGAAPSQILGKLQAEGTVYLINNNGIVFGAGSQVNTNSLIATSLNLYSNDAASGNRTFLDPNQGITRFIGEVSQELPPGSVLVDPGVAGGAAGNIEIERGASITTAPLGFSLIAGPNVTNAGRIRARDGQTILIGARNVLLEPDGGNATRTAARLRPYAATVAGMVADTSVRNTGLIESTRGNATLIARDVQQNGVLSVTSGISNPGSIVLSDGRSGVAGSDGGLGTGRVSFGRDAVTAILPDRAVSETTTSSSAATQSFQPGRIEIDASVVNFGENALLKAPGARLDIRAEGLPTEVVEAGLPGRVFVDRGAQLDLSGLANVTPLAGSTLVTVARVGQNELANSPVQRNAFLFRQTNVVVDGQLRGVRADGTPWVGSPLLNATGFVEQTPRAIDELLTRGGSISISGAQFITREGSLINLDGGYLRYGDAARASTRLITADGHLVNIGEADALRAIAGFAGTQVIEHSRYSITQTFVDPIIGGRAARLADSYIEGGNAGSLQVTANVGAPGSGNGLLLFGGDVSAQALAGREQVRNGSLPSGGSFDLDTLSALVIRDTSPLPGDLAANFSATTQISPAIAAGRSPQDPANLQYWTALSGVQLSNAGFSSLNLAASQVIVEAGQGLQLQAGSRIALSGGRIDIGADLVTAGGSITLQSAASGRPDLTSISFVDPASTAPLLTGDLVIRDGVTLSTRGRFVNDAYLAPDQRHGRAFIDGGSISLSVGATEARPLISGIRGGTGDNAPVLGDALDTTGNLVLGIGSLLDVSGGGYVDADGRVAQRDLVPLGSGGNISLATYPRVGQQGAIGILPTAQAEVGRIKPGDGDLASHLLAYGFSGGGTLRLRTLGLQIGGDPAQAGEALYLSPDFFSRQGFANYDLSAAWDATIAGDTTVRVSHRNLVAGFVDILSAATGADLYAPAADGTVFSTLATLDDFRRTATDFNLTSGDYLNANIFTRRNAPRDGGVTGTTLLSAGSSIVADAGADIRLASTNQVTVLGSITAHGGSITFSGDSSRAIGSNSNSGLSPPSDPFALIYTTLDKSVWLGAQARLDVSGVSLLDPQAASVLDASGQRVTPRSGRVLDGGTVTLTSDSGHVIALAGSVIEASGTQDRYDLLEATGSLIPGQRFRRSGTSTAVYSDGGEIRLGTAGGLLFDGTLRAAAGSAEARGGRLSIIAEDAPFNLRQPADSAGSESAFFVASARSILFSQSGTFVPQGLLPGEQIEEGISRPDSTTPSTSGRLYFAADRLNGSGIDDLVIGQRLDLSPLTQPLTIAFAGDVRLAVPGSITIAAHRYLALPAGSLIIPAPDVTTGAESIGAPQINLEAAYVSFGGTTFNSRLGLDVQTRVNDAVLTVNAARGLDLVGNFALQNFAQSTFRTQGDIRLYSPVGNNLNSANTALVPGSLFTGGNLTLAAAQIYPASGNRYILAAAGPNPTTIRFEQTAAAPTALPLSAGGSLLVDASTIEQAGTLRAPSGLIRLGISDPLDPASLALFGGFRLATSDGTVSIGALPLVATTDVQLAGGSLTSVSSAGLVVPYGFTVDGRELQYDAVFGSQLPAAASLLSAPPAKQVLIEAANVSLDAGAQVDLSGGGDLQAQEFVPGTGGTRDVLARSSTAPGSTQATSLFPDGREVYAILPGYRAPAGAYDPAIDSSGSGALVGRSVHLSGVGDLPEGDYILLPARYATLPGAYRVVQDTGARDSIAAANVVLPDGSYLSAGYFQDGYARVGRSESARDARSTRFIVQTNAVWQQYSQYTLTSANDYFSRLAADAGTVAAQRPLDAGQLVLAATRSVNLDATLNAAGGQRSIVRADGSTVIERGTAAQVDIAARDIQIIGTGATTRDGYVQLAVGDLNGIGAASLLVGGVRSSDSAGTTIRALANSVVVSNDEASALTGSELILVTRTDAAAAGSADADPNAANGLLIDSGSVIRTTPLSEEDAAQPVATGAPLLIAGDGALLRVSNRDAAPVIRSSVSADGGRGLLQLGDGVRVAGGRSLTLDASRDVIVDPTARFSARVIEAKAGSISFVADGVSTTTGGLVIGSGTLAQLAASDSLRLRSSGLISFLGQRGTAATPDLAPLDIVLGNSTLDLRATGFISDGGAVSITARSLSFGGIGDSASAVAPPAESTNALRLNVGSLRFGAGSTRFAGFGTVNATVRDRIIGSGIGRFDFDRSTVALTAPLFTVDTAADTRLLTLGNLSLSDAASTAASLDGGLGGALSLTAAALDIDSRLAARAGLLNLQATSGDLRLGTAAELSVAGLARTFFDTTQFASAGAISLDATLGNVVLDSASTFDISAAAAGGDAGRLAISALNQTLDLAGTGRVLGSAATGYEGGVYRLDIGSSVDLNAVASALTAGGVNQQIAIHSRRGNLILDSGNRLTARDISLTADVPLTPVEGSAAVPAISAEHGHIGINGTLDASGTKGGQIALNGFSGVAVNGSLLARGSSATERGGRVSLSTGTVATPATGGPGAALDPTFGYQAIAAANAGRIVLGSGSTVDVSGGRAGGLEGGTLNLRAGLVDGGEVNVEINAGAAITGAREVGVEAYAVWSAADAGSGFNGVIDPASNPAFYTNTLQGFLQQAPLAFETRLAGVAGLKTRLGIELRNPDLTVNNGDITVASNWNLGAADLDANGNVVRFRYRHGDEAPVVTLRAANNVQVNASLSDGFVQLSNPLGLQAPRARSLAQVAALYEVLTRAYPALAGQIDAPAMLTGDGSPAQDAQIAQYYGLYEQYLNYLLYGLLPVGQLDARPITALAPASRIELLGVARLGLGAPQLPLNAQGYAQYLLDYNAYLARIEGGFLNRRIALPDAPRPMLAPVFTGAALATVDNSESPVSTAENPLPLAAASLAGGASSSFRLIAGAESTSANVLALRPSSAFTGAVGVLTNGGNVFVSGNTSYTDPVTRGIAFQPTMIRTGTGSIDIAAARDFELNDGVAPGVVYTAGAPRAGTAAETGSRILQPGLFDPRYTDGVIGDVAVGQYIVSGIVQPEAAGDIRLVAQRDITGVQSAYSNSSNAGQYWWQWLDTGNDVRRSLDSLHFGNTQLVAGGIAEVLSTSINFGAFGQGFLSVGGDIDIDAGRNITSLSVSLPTTYFRSTGEDGSQVINTAGGGDLRVHAGGDLLSGSYFVAQGEGRIRTDGQIGSSRGTGVNGLATILAVQDGVLDVAARGSVTLAGLYNPSYLPASLPGPLFSANSQAYSARSAISVTATTGDLRYGSLPIDLSNDVFGTGLSLPGNGSVRRDGDILPATVRLTALDGSLSIEKSGGLFPSSIGNLNLFANDSIRFASTMTINLIDDGNDSRDDRYFGLIDADPTNLPSALNQPTAAGAANLAPSLTTGYRYISSTSNALLHAQTALHGTDYTPARIYALTGDIRGGVVGSDGILRDALVLAPDKAALVQAGRDIVNLSFQGQHVHNSDVSRIVAGRDLLDTTGGIDESVNGRNVFGSEPSLVLAGPGELQIVAGRNIGPLTNQNQIIDGRSRPVDPSNSVPRDVGSAPITGINSVGNLFNPFLPRDGADITVQFGVGPGMATQAFIDRYIDPATAAPAPGVRRYDAELVRFIQDYQQGLDVNTGFVRDQRPLPPALLPGEAYAVFRALPTYIQQRFVGQVFFDVLRTVGIDFGNPDSPFNGQYVRGYQAIETLFPSALGYTANNLTGVGANGALLDAAGNPMLASTGNLDLRGTTVQSQQGGTISIFGPGGEALLGSTSAPPFATDAQGRLFAGPGTQGLLSLEQGDIRLFTDRSLLLAQSRVFTEQGGNIVIWSSNADINAGRGARTTAELPLPSFTCNVDFYCLVDARGQVSGAGIATLQTVAGAEPGDVALIAPAGTVDAGDAGIRVSGNLIVAARAVANADNVQVQGTSIGLRLSAIDSGTLNSGSAAAAAATQQAAALAARPIDRAATVITVEVYGFGTPDEEQKRRLQR